MPGFIGERGGARTLDPVIKSHVLYQLSYALHLPDQILNSAGIYQPLRANCALFPAGFARLGLVAQVNRPK